MIELVQSYVGHECLVGDRLNKILFIESDRAIDFNTRHRVRCVKICIRLCTINFYHLPKIRTSRHYLNCEMWRDVPYFLHSVKIDSAKPNTDFDTTSLSKYCAGAPNLIF